MKTLVEGCGKYCPDATLAIISNQELIEVDQDELLVMGSRLSATVDGGEVWSKPLRDVCGSKSYAAPEVLASKGYDGFAVDNLTIYKQNTAFLPNPQQSQATIDLAANPLAPSAVGPGRWHGRAPRPRRKPRAP